MIIMTYKTVSLNEKAFALLKKAKKDNESFSDTVIRILSKPDIAKFLSLAGTLKNDVSDDEMEEFITEAKTAWK